jgi:hypothetical protein
LLGIIKLGRERNQTVREKLGVQNWVCRIRSEGTAMSTKVAPALKREWTKQALQCKPKGVET